VAHEVHFGGFAIPIFGYIAVPESRDSAALIGHLSFTPESGAAGSEQALDVIAPSKAQRLLRGEISRRVRASRPLVSVTVRAARLDTGLVAHDYPGGIRTH
jgi:hypothetical protein